LYLTYLGFIIGDILTIWNPEYNNTFYLFGVPVRDIALIFMLLFFFINQKMIFSLISKKVLCLYIIVISYFTLYGIIMNGQWGWLRSDLRFFLWFLGGICFGSVLIKTGQIRKNLQIIVGLTAILMLVAALSGEAFQMSRDTQIAELGRISEVGIYNFGGLLYVPLILLFYMKKDSWRTQIIPILSIGVIFFTGVFLANTRSIGIILVVILLLYILSYGVKNHGVIIDRIKLKKYLCFAIIIGLISVFSFLYILSINLRLERMLNVSITAISDELRYLEAILFYEQGIQDNTLIFGKGLGGTIISPISDWDETGCMHIGILNFWMKMGLVPFIIIAVYLFIGLPIYYIMNLIKSTSRLSYIKTANLIAISSIFPWIVSLAISGGFAPQDSLYVGVAYLIRGEIAKNGLRRFLH